jgi:hypothetical protein
MVCFSERRFAFREQIQWVRCPSLKVGRVAGEGFGFSEKIKREAWMRYADADHHVDLVGGLGRN